MYSSPCDVKKKFPDVLSEFIRERTNQGSKHELVKTLRKRLKLGSKYFHGVRDYRFIIKESVS